MRKGAGIAGPFLCSPAWQVSAKLQFWPCAQKLDRTSMAPISGALPMARLDLNDIPEHQGSTYPKPFDREVGHRIRQRLGDAGGLTQFGVNLMQLPPTSAWSAQRHWHSAEDEFVYVVAGEVVLVTDKGEEVMRVGDCAAFPANTPNGHHLINKSGSMAVYLEVGSRIASDRVVYPDIDLVFDSNADGYAHKDGTPYPST
ncbi:MAG: cupin domain-containing protein [Lysobacter sp.]